MKTEGLPTERWRRVGEIFDAAVACPENHRQALLDRQCGDSSTLRRDVERLLENDRQASSFLKEPLLRLGEDAPDSSLEGRSLGPYRLRRELGRGGMGAVYLASRDDDEYRQQVAIKLVRQGLESAEMLRRFRSERQILARLSHPSIARLFDGGTTAEGVPFLVMEYVDGVPITQYCDRERLGIEARLRLFAQICSAVQHAHQNLLVHRDLKPANILVTRSGIPKLLDFGIAKLIPDHTLGDEAQTRLDQRTRLNQRTRLDHRPMTLDYASPEQVRGDAINTASDVYSLGVLLYELLTGRSPYPLGKRPMPHELERAICEREPRKPSRAAIAEPDAETFSSARSCTPRQLRQRLRGDLDAILLKALRKEPWRRYGSAQQLAADIEHTLAQRPITARPPTLGYRTSAFVKRHRLPVGLSGAFLFMILILAASFLVTLSQHATDVAQERDRADQVADFMMDLFAVTNPDDEMASSVTARELLDRGATRITEDLADQPEVQAMLLNTFGEVYRQLGLTEQARSMVEQSLTLWRQQESGENPAQLASTLLHLGRVLIDAGEMERAEELLREALAIERDLSGDEHPKTVRALLALAELRHRLFDLEGAEELGCEALAAGEATLEPGDRRLAESLDSLGRLSVDKGVREDAETFFDQALAVRRQALGEHHPEVAKTLSEIGMLWYSRGELDEAEGFFRQALGTQREILGESHPEVVETLRRLAFILSETGRYEEAETTMRESLAIQRTLDADGLTPLSGEMLGDFGIMLNYRGAYDEALEVLLEAGTIVRRTYGDDHPHVAANHQSLARVYQNMGQQQLALEHYRESAEMSARNLPEGHRFTAYPLIGWSELLLEMGQLDAAEDLSLKALEILSASLPTDHWRLAQARSVQGAILAARGQEHEATRLLRESHAVLKSRRGSEARVTRQAAAWLEALDLKNQSNG